jgi:hypothetical protein
MNLKMKVGAEPKKVAILGGLLVVAFLFYLFNRNSGDSTPARSAGSKAAPAAAARPTVRPASRTVRVTQGGVNQNAREFRPKFGKSAIDPSSVDPTLHLGELAKLQEVKVEGTTRSSLFDFASGPPVALSAVKEPVKIAVAKPLVGPMPPPPPPPPPPTPNAPAIPLKFYGFVNPARVSPKRAFFLSGDEIIIASEGDLVSKRYKIVRIGVNSALVEDTQFKGNNTQQTLPLEAEMPG